MQPCSSRLRLASFAFPLLIAASVPASAQGLRVTVEGQPTLASVATVYLYSPGSLPACGYVPEPTLQPGLLAATGFAFGAGDSPASIASGLAAGINSLSGFWAVAVGDEVLVQGSAAFEVAVESPLEMLGCDEAGAHAVRLTDCAISNLANGVICDETAVHSGGFRLSGVTASTVPALPARALVVLFLVGGAGLLLLLRRRPAVPCA